jgi:hypothetical protein
VARRAGAAPGARGRASAAGPGGAGLRGRTRVAHTAGPACLRIGSRLARERRGTTSRRRCTCRSCRRAQRRTPGPSHRTRRLPSRGSSRGCPRPGAGADRRCLPAMRTRSSAPREPAAPPATTDARRVSQRPHDGRRPHHRELTPTAASARVSSEGQNPHRRVDRIEPSVAPTPEFTQ